MNPPFRDQNVSLRCIPLPTQPHISQENERDFGQNAKKHENTNALNKQKRAISVCKCWLNCELVSFEAMVSLDKTINDPTPSGSAVLFLHIVIQKRYPSTVDNFYLFSCHSKNLDGHGKVHFWDQRKAATPIPHPCLNSRSCGISVSSALLLATWVDAGKEGGGCWTGDHVRGRLSVFDAAFTKSGSVPNGKREPNRATDSTLLSRPFALWPRGLSQQCIWPVQDSGVFATPVVTPLGDRSLVPRKPSEKCVRSRAKPPAELHGFSCDSNSSFRFSVFVLLRFLCLYSRRRRVLSLSHR